MNPDDIARILDDLGQRLGPAGQYVFGLAVRQAFIDGLLQTGIAVVGLTVVGVVVLAAARISRRQWARESADKRDSYYSKPDILDYVFPWMLGGIGGVFAVGFLLILLMTGLLKLLNPEYAALTDILGRIVK